MVRVFSLSKYLTMVGEIYHIYNIQITEKYLCENSPLSWHDLIIILPFRTLPLPINLPKMFVLHEKLFLEKCDHHTLVAGRHRELLMLVKQKSLLPPRNLDHATSSKLLIVFLTRVNLLYVLFLMALKCFL